MKVVYVPGLEDSLKRIIGENAAVLVDGKIAESAVPEEIARTAQLDALRFSTAPKFLWNLGEATVPMPNGDGWVASPVPAEGVTSLEVTAGGVTAKIVPSGGRLYASSVAEDFADGEYLDLGGTTRRTVAAEMLASLGLKATGEEELKSFAKTALHVGNGSSSTVTLSGLDPKKNYALYYLSGTAAGKESGFMFNGGGYAGHPAVQYAAGAAAAGWTDGDLGEAVAAAAGQPLAVRVSNLRANADKKLVFNVRGAAGNLIAVAEYEVMAHVSDVGGGLSEVPEATAGTIGGVKIVRSEKPEASADAVETYTASAVNAIATGIRNAATALGERVGAVERTIGDVDAALDEINGEVV